MEAERVSTIIKHIENGKDLYCIGSKSLKVVTGVKKVSIEFNGGQNQLTFNGCVFNDESIFLNYDKAKEKFESHFIRGEVY